MLTAHLCLHTYLSIYSSHLVHFPLLSQSCPSTIEVVMVTQAQECHPSSRSCQPYMMSITVTTEELVCNSRNTVIP